MLKNLTDSYLKCIFSLSFLWLIASCSFFEKTAKRYFDKSLTKTYDVIAVPGVPFYEAGWDSIMRGRVYWSKYLFDKGIAKNIMYSGSSVYTPYYEGEIMALYAIAIGIPKEHVFTEIKAEHSVENLYYCYLKSKKLGFNSIALATDPFQSKQLKHFARVRIGEDVGIIPFVIDTLRSLHPIMINPTIDYQQAYNKNFVSLTKRESLWKRLRGTLGKNIDYNAY
jgi:uncharacterized SAM-binding protein YcdF (DUF218 family)